MILSDWIAEYIESPPEDIANGIDELIGKELAPFIAASCVLQGHSSDDGITLSMGIAVALSAIVKYGVPSDLEQLLAIKVEA